MANTENNIEPAPYRVERLDENRLKDLMLLYKAVYNHERPQNYFAKKYATAYTGVQFTGYIAYSHEDVPVAFYGVIPCFVKYQNEIVLAAQSADTMTHPRHRNKGLFVKLATITFDLCRVSGITFVFGFPNQESYPGFLHKLEWQVTEVMDSFNIPVKTFPLESAALKFKWLRPAYRYYVKWVLRKYFLSLNGFPNSIIANEYAGIFRNEQYLQYKMYGSSLVIQLGKVKVWIKINNGLHIGDIDVFNSDDDLDLLMNEVIKIARRLGVRRIISQASSQTYLHRFFLIKYTPVPAFPVMFLNLGTDISLDKLKFTLADIDIF